MRGEILEFMSRADYRPARGRAVAREMGIPEHNYPEFRQAVTELLREGRIADSGGRLAMGAAPRLVEGVFRGSRRGFGFVTPSVATGFGDLHIPAGATLNAVSGDTVRARVEQSGRRGGRMSFVGRIVEILQRGHSRVVGVLQQVGTRWHVEPNGTKLHAPVVVDDVSARNARAGDQVVVEIAEYAEPGRPARGVIVERLGAHGDAGVDLLSIIRQHDLPSEFSAEAMADAGAAARRYRAEDELAKRLDLRETLIITIDPKDARDYDDAISLRRLGDGGRERGEGRIRRRSASATRGTPCWELGVHIADVSHFVPVGGGLDVDALDRGTSVYFPRYVVPMLPEVLSNGVCSLQEGVPRLCKSAFIQYDEGGHPVAARFDNSVIRSTKRLTYEQASDVLEGRTGGIPSEVVALLKEMETLARTIRGRRLREGMLVLDLPEVELVLDEEGRVTDAHPADTSFSHTLIEMFMVEANEAVARHLTARGVPFVRRVHPEPDPEALESLSKFLATIGIRVPKRPDRFDLQGLLDRVRGRAAARMINLSVLRSMAQAVYAPREEGHYALASKCYSHFTSPIRRYPDLHVHRLLNELIEADREGGGSGRAARDSARAGRRKARRDAAEAEAHSAEDSRSMSLEELGAHCSARERRAQDAERELRLVKVLELMATRVGEVFDGLVTGVANFGVFVQHPHFLVEGMIETADLPDDRWQLDDSRSCLRGARSGARFRLGDSMQVVIARVEVHARRMLLVPVEQAGANRGAPRDSHKGDRRDGGRRGAASTTPGSSGERTSERRGRSGRGGSKRGGGSHQGGTPRRGGKRGGRGGSKSRRRF